MEKLLIVITGDQSRVSQNVLMQIMVRVGKIHEPEVTSK